MATKKPAGSTTTALANWDAEMAKYAAAAAKTQESIAGGQFFSVRGGQLSFNDAPFANNEMAVIILDSILENNFYTTKFDPENPVPPDCFAFGRDPKEMAPHEVVVTPQHDRCAGCPMNEFGTADTGRGKACANRQRIAMISGGRLDGGKFTATEAEDELMATAMAYLRLSVTSMRGYATYVKQLAGSLHRPPFMVYTKVKVVPDPAKQFVVTFEALGLVPAPLFATLLKRHEQAEAEIAFPYLPLEEAAVTPARAAKGAPARSPVARKGAAAKKAPTAARRAKF